MTTRGQINSNFYQIVNVDANGNPTSIKSGYIDITSVDHANVADVANSIVGSNVSGYVANASHATISDSANTVAGANVTGIVANANYASYSSNSNSVNASISNVNISGGSSGYVLSTNGSGTLSWSAPSVGTSSISNGTSNVSIATSDGNITMGVNSHSNMVIVSNVGMNVDGYVTAQTFYGNIVGNISGNFVVPGINTSVIFNTTGNADGVNNFLYDKVIGLLSVDNIEANGALLFDINGSNVVGDVSGSNHANISDEANLVSGSNVSGDVAGANHANISDSANSVAVANVTGIGNIATINLDGSSSNVLYGNGVWAGVSATTANYANYAGNVTISAQPNITSLGNLLNLQFSNTVTPIASPNVGEMFWDTGEHTVSLGMENGVIQQIGLENYIYVKASSTITDGQVVMFTGANGDNVTAAPANAASAGFKPEYILGIATQTIATNGFGYITTTGKVHGLNTNSFTVGDILWYDPTSTTGAITNVQPTDPACQVQVGAVTKKSAGDGHIQVLVNPLASLTQLTDVTITTPTTGEALIYNGSNVWINGNPNVANYAATVTASSQPNITSLGTLTSLSTSGQITSSVATGTAPLVINSTTLVPNLNVANATYATSAGSATTAATVTTNAQPNITSLGSLTGLTVSNATGIVNFVTTANVSLGSVGNLHITGGSPSQVLTTDGSGTLSWTTPAGATPAGANTQIQFNNAGSFGASANLTFNNTTNTLSATNITGTLTTASQPNITSVGSTLTVATSVRTSNLVAQTGGITTVQLRYGAVDGAVGITSDLTVGAGGTGNISVAGTTTGTRFISNVATGTAPFTVTSTTQVANLNVATAGTAGTVTTNAQPNITSTGTLTSVTVSGTGNIGNLVTTKYNETVVAGGSTGAATITPDVATGTIFNYTLTGNITLSTLANAVAGSGATIILTQDGTGNRTLTSTMKFLGGSKTLSTSAGAIDIMSVFYDGSTYYASLGKGFA